MIFTPSWSPKWWKIGVAKKLILNLGIERKGCTYEYSKIIKRVRFITSK